MRRLTAAPARLTMLAALASACASPGFPPGGPEDRDPPQLEATTPDSGALDVRPSRILFRFDEVVSERPSGAQNLNRLFLISPRDGEPRVDWDREVVRVRPRRGWRPNTTYTITMLPGMSDLRGNTAKTGAVTVFSTGSSIPPTRIRGVVFDWPAGQLLARALVEAVSADSTVYVTQADSSGTFELPFLPPGGYVVRAVGDQNGNYVRDPRELWDSVAVTLADTARVELLAFVHDTVGPRIASLAVRDSVTIRVGFDQPIAPDAVPDTSRFTLQRADSSRIPVLQVRAARAFETEAAERARADTAARDSARATGRRAARPGARDTTRG
ncbi:MAG TPA: Ig-like domain-containing protein, partial [Gemmatimonadaceae bacterium]|nr:Ig-like domain-containing protein [Gemmatimonadaceae bacterium]